MTVTCNNTCTSTVTITLYFLQKTSTTTANYREKGTTIIPRKAHYLPNRWLIILLCATTSMINEDLSLLASDNKPGSLPQVFANSMIIDLQDKSDDVDVGKEALRNAIANMSTPKTLAEINSTNLKAKVWIK